MRGYPCKKYDGADLYDSFIIHKNQLSDLDKAKRIGPEAYKNELDEKIKFLKELLYNYDDGRRKSFFCAAVNLLELGDIRSVMEKITGEIEPETPLKIKAASAVRLFDETAAKKDISLKLRKNKKN